MQYRTREQFVEIITSAINGNWSQAEEECVEYGFYANDLIKAYQAIKDEYGSDKPFTYFDEADLAIIAEGAADLRNKEA